MTDPEEHDERDDDPLDDALDQALDGGFAAARNEHDADPEPGDSVLDRIGEITGSKPNVLLRAADASGHTPMPKPLGPDSGDPDRDRAGRARAHQAGKYVVHGELGRGGVGAVHRGHDQDLGRDVAMKFLHDKYTDEPTVLHRFVEEAQIGGQLQHPGIVPVYDLGMSDGKPFFTMKLVKGKTLAQALAERGSPATDRRRFLAIFEQICQTMAYAHARGVVHRDLKPANIMTGSFGEVQVVDWGMGKVLERGASESARADEQPASERQHRPSVIETVRSGGHGTQSVMGSVMGTPAYMPPEQARGDVDAMDARSDVFALGSILCEILTGQPPYVGEPDELFGMAAMGKLDDAHRRLVDCGAGADLVELTIRCLMPAPAARPQSAEAVATTVQEHLAAAEQRVHDATVRALALKRTQKLGIALTLVIAVGLAASLWFWRAASEAAANERTAATNEKEARQLADARTQEAQTNLDNFNRLSHVVRLESAKVDEKALYPAWPDSAQVMRDWLEGDARALREALPELRATRAALAARALPQTGEEKALARASGLYSAELVALERRLSSLQRAHAIRSGTATHEPVALDEAVLSRSAGEVAYRELAALARPLVDPERETFGREPEGLALARRAVPLAPKTGDDRAMVADTLAWALFAIGLDDEALEQSRAACAAATEARRTEYEGRSRELQQAIESARSPEGLAALAELHAAVRERRAEAADRFLQDTLGALVADIERFANEEVAAVEQRLAWSERVEELTINRHRAKWDEARLAILKADGISASRLYGEATIELQPQMGLVPIGMNPQSKLWEFYHLRSAWDPNRQPDPASIEIPTHDESGKLDMDGRGIVFVLIPGGKFSMGAQSRDESLPNFHADARGDEGPVHEVELAPYLLAKHELTQGQWARLTDGARPSMYRLGQKYNGIPVLIGDSHPVEHVDFTTCDHLLTKHGLVLPTEAQWEYGCRGGEPTAWFTGDELGSLEGFANVLDQTGQNVPPRWTGGAPFDDHFKGPAPVGTYDPNSFGLHDVHGNVSEWCRDWFGRYTLPARAGDGLRQGAPSSGPRASRVDRGGGYRAPGRFARSALRSPDAPSQRNGALGVRPAREILP